MAKSPKDSPAESYKMIHFRKFAVVSALLAQLLVSLMLAIAGQYEVVRVVDEIK
jgi:hypothetical protein